MAIVFPLSLPPAPVSRSVKITPLAVVAMNESPFTLKQEVFEHLGQAWRMDIDLPPMTRGLAEDWITFGLSLNGNFGTFLMGDPAAKTPRGIPSGAPVIDGAGQSRSKEVMTRGWNPSAVAVLLRGDYIQLGAGSTAHMYKVLSDVTADALGKATLDIWPRVRGVLADGETVTTSNCVGVWRMAGSGGWSVGEAKIYGINFSAIEAQ